MGKLILVTGAARSGKSEVAEYLAAQTTSSVTYVATARLNREDPEWQTRIDRHRRRRPPEWELAEVPVELSQALRDRDRPEACFLVDSLGTWVANTLDWDETSWLKVAEEFVTTARSLAGTCVLVAEETGWGVVPAYPLGRQFRDRLGRLTRDLGTKADETYLVVAGRVLNLSQLGQPLSDFLMRSPATKF